MNSLANSLSIGWQRNGDYAAQLISDLSEEQMVVQPATGMNHPAWIFSHLNAYHPVLLSLLRGQTFEDPKFHPFGMQSQPQADRSVYASKSDLLSSFELGHADVAAVLSAAPSAALEQPMTLDRWKTPFPTVGSSLGYLMLAHESTHLGQLSAWRRVQGLPSV